LKSGNLSRDSGKVVRGRNPESFCPERMATSSDEKYIEKEGLLGFETHKGCSSVCAYCIEAGTPVIFRQPRDVICELSQLVDQGYGHLHLCDSEFNEDLNYSTAFLDEVIREDLAFKWALYMKPGNFDGRLFELLKKSGAYLITLTVDTFQRGHDYWRAVERMVALGRKTGIRICIDLLTGFPYENEEVTKRVLDLFRRTGPDEVVINVFIRLYRNLSITKIIDNDPLLNKYLFGAGPGEEGLLSPYFYNSLPVEWVKELIHGEDLFRIAGEEKVVNYQKA
jgi:tRNA A37 methylthiotransferase MiaB